MRQVQLGIIEKCKGVLSLPPISRARESIAGQDGVACQMGRGDTWQKCVSQFGWVGGFMRMDRAATGLDAYPVVAAVRLDDKLDPEMESRLYYDVELFMEANDADAALWYRLDSADLRPSEPR